ncbi:MAG: alpha/beta fold hydrolase [Lachnospiraceae bacterium]|jgi:dienelactone hydrolase|nr:alpha/beta fold hydrolase [Lachnospiraceae bacterium]
MRRIALILGILLYLTACQGKDAIQSSLDEQSSVNIEYTEGTSDDPIHTAENLESTETTTISSDETTDVELSDDMPAFVEESVIFKAADKFPIPGTLLIPQGQADPVPAVILVQGSGQTDRDETGYAYKPFRDIAEALAREGIAVLRYDKRFYVHQMNAQEFADFTVKEEIIDDAIAATNFLKADTRIDSNKVFIIGHSLGGMLAPRIDAEGGNYAGIIILAGSPRSFSEIAIDQYEATAETLSQSDRELLLTQIQEMKDFFDQITDMTDEEAKQIAMLGASGYYYKELDAHPASDYLTQLTKPILILQGERDFQVYADIDFVAYQQLLGDHENVTFQLYPDLNHCFILSTLGTVEEYMIEDQVDEQVLADIIQWIKQWSET